MSAPALSLPAPISRGFAVVGLGRCLGFGPKGCTLLAAGAFVAKGAAIGGWVDPSTGLPVVEPVLLIPVDPTGICGYWLAKDAAAVIATHYGETSYAIVRNETGPSLEIHETAGGEPVVLRGLAVYQWNGLEDALARFPNGFTSLVVDGARIILAA